MPKISVIIPIYNAQDSLARCLDSLLAQTLADFELLLINDGSQDDSAKICEDYAAHDGRIKVFHQENGGVSRARQKGLEQATGDYLIHVDADDWVSPQYLQLLYEEALRSGADIVLCDFEEIYLNKRVRNSAAPTSDQPEDLVYDLCTRLYGSCWNKLVRRAIIEEHKIGFPEGINIREDLLFNLQIAIHSKRIVYVPQVLYYYDQTQEGSLTRGNNTLQVVESYLFARNWFHAIQSVYSSPILERSHRSLLVSTLVCVLILNRELLHLLAEEVRFFSSFSVSEIWSYTHLTFKSRILLMFFNLLPNSWVFAMIDMAKLLR